ncbi:hypothetical protein LY78DRAFT_317406 [Colletotrichum sublineola]|nr:hypothetical protein LY78DRAFT_317406 [Colletotrichum sublineola]
MRYTMLPNLWSLVALWDAGARRRPGRRERKPSTWLPEQSTNTKTSYIQLTESMDRATGKSGVWPASMGRDRRWYTRTMPLPVLGLAHLGCLPAPFLHLCVQGSGASSNSRGHIHVARRLPRPRCTAYHRVPKQAPAPLGLNVLTQDRRRRRGV